jgi:hypothetical protein
MREFKHSELRRVDHVLDTLVPVDAHAATSEVREKIRFFESRRAEIVSLPEWPFDFRAFLGAIASSAMIALPPLISSFVAVVTKAAAAH